MPNSDRCHKPHGVVELGKLPGPVVGTGAGFHTDQAGWQVGYEFEQLGTRDFWAHQGRFVVDVNYPDRSATTILAGGSGE